MKATNKKLGTRIISVGLGVVMTASALALAACKSGSGKYNPELQPVTFSIGELDGVFNPFFSTSAYDSEITGMTTIGMLSSDANGGIAYGRDEAVLTLDYKQTMYTDAGVETDDGAYASTTEYEFLIKNGVKDSTGNPITIKDVLFNMYVYLDPAYNGSSTMYSTKIKGLSKYKTGADSEEEANAFETSLTSEAIGERQNFINFTLGEAGDKDHNYNATPEERKRFAGYWTKLCELFDEMLKTDWNGAATDMESVNESYILVDPIEYRTNKQTPRTYDITRTWEYFLILEGMVQFVEVNGSYSLKVGDGNDQTVRYYVMIDDGMIDAIDDAIKDKPEDAKTAAEQEVVFEAMKSEYKKYDEVEMLALGFSISSDFLNHIRDVLRPGLTPSDTAENIEGIETYTTKEFNGKTYASDHDVLKITINGIDPKAIWNFAFSVVPMKYYTSEEEYNQFNIEENHFGLKKGDSDFRDDYLKSSTRIGLPVGAGPYMASKASGGAATSYNQFLDKNVVYFERNPYFYTLGIDSETATEADYNKSASEADTPIHNAIVKYLRYQVVSTTAVMNAMIAGEIDFSSDISAKQENINTINGIKNLTYARQPNNGYGYIGVNPKYVPDIEVRRIIMYAMDRQLITEDYYTDGLGELIERPMTTNSWAYPKNTPAYYTVDWFIQHYQEKYGKTLTPPADPTTPDSAFIEEMLQALGYTKSGGVYQKGLGTGNAVTSKLDYTFTIAGDSKDHPAYSVFASAAKYLNEAGMNIKVRTSADALSKLSSGLLAVWAAAWSSTIDPDMYQVYHKYSQATSVNNWGYSEILSDQKGVYTEEQRIINELSENIDDGRAYLDQDLRVTYYHLALDNVMELAVELPTYQRVNLLVYNSSKINPASLTRGNLTAYQGLIDKIWELDLL